MSFRLTHCGYFNKDVKSCGLRMDLYLVGFAKDLVVG